MIIFSFAIRVITRDLECNTDKHHEVREDEGNE
jgi:ribose 1,5-bisphosphokinase PhnN